MKPADRRVREMLRLKCRSPRSASLYEHVLVSVGDLTKPNVAGWWAKVNADGLADGSIRTYYAVLKSVCRFLSEEHRDADAAQALRFLRTVNVPPANNSVVRRKPLTSKERNKIHAVMPDRMALFMDLVRYTGLRVSTALSCTRENILHRDGGYFVSVRGKRAKLFEWPLPSSLAQRLLNLSDPFFKFSRFDFYRSLRRAAEAEIGRSISPHDLRRAFASRIWSSTHDLLFLARSLAHSSPTTSMRYVVHDESKAREVLKNL